MWQTIINYYIGILIMMIGVVIFGKIILKEPIKLPKIKFILLILITCIIHTIIYYNFTGATKTVIVSIINICFYIIIFKITVRKAIASTIMYTILLIIPEAIEILFITKILKLSPEYCYNTYAGSIIGNLTIVIIFSIMIYIFKKPIRRIINIKIEDNIKILLYYIFTLICIAIFFYKAFMNLVIDFNFFISIFVMLTFLAILGSLIKQTLTNNKLTKEYDNLLEFMTTFEMEIEKQRIQRHETKNEFLTIRAKLCDNQKNNEIVNYIDEILQEKIKVKQEEYAKFGYLPPNGIKGLCYFKVQEAENKGISVALNISKKIKESPLNELNTKEQKEFGRILGVLLDNAIEASIDSKEKKIGIEFYSNSKDPFKMIISNTYNNIIDKDKISKERFSTKGKNRGHGLLLVKHIINNNSLFELNTEIRDDLYIQTVNIKKV